MAIIAYIAVCVLFKIPSVWYSTALSFPAGVFAAIYEKKERSFPFSGCKVAIPIVSTCIFVGMSMMRIEYAMTSTLGSLSFAFVIWALCERIEMKNKMLAFFGTISWEFYLCHTRLLFIGKDRFADSPLVWFIFSFLCSVIIAKSLHLLLDLILKRVNQKRN